MKNNIDLSTQTTGRPKGIGNPHMAPVFSYDLRFQLSDLSPGDRVACNVFFIWYVQYPYSFGKLPEPQRSKYIFTAGKDGWPPLL
jgi:hypothetical protein